MISSQEEVKQFETKFKGSLEKLDEFEKEWSQFKTNQFPLTSNNLNSSHGQYDFNQKLEALNLLHSSFDDGQQQNNTSSSTKNIRKLDQNELHSYQVANNQSKVDYSKDLNKGNNLKGQLDQIIESPRESMLQSPSSNYKEKFQQNATQESRSTFASVQKHQLVQDLKQSASGNKECKTLKIDLNNESGTQQKAHQESRNAKQLPKSINFKDSSQKDETQTSQFTLSNQSIKPTLKTPQSASLAGQAKKSLSSQVSQNISTKPKERSDSRSKQKPKEVPLVSQSLQSIPKKDDLVERVIESIKVLSKKEEDIKAQLQTQTQSQKSQLLSQPKKQPQQQLAAQIQKEEQQNPLQPYQQRRRTNTLTVGERPNLLLGLSNSNKQQDETPKETVIHRNQVPTHKAIINSQPPTTNAAAQSGFIGNSFVRAAAEKMNQLQPSVSSVEQVPIKDPKAQVEIEQPKPTLKPQLKMVPQRTEQNKGPQLTQTSKEKVEILRKAFTNSKDNLISKSSKNLTTTPQQQAQNILKQQQLIDSKTLSQPSLLQQKSQITQQSLKSDKITKRADISLVNNEELNSKSQNQSMSSFQPNNATFTSTNTTPNKSQITSLKKSSQVTPSKNNSNNSSQSNLMNNSSNPSLSNNLAVKKTQSQNTSLAITKAKNRRQPTQTQFDCGTLIQKEESAVKDQKKDVSEVQKVDVQKAQKKTRTLLDDYFACSPLDSKRTLLKDNNLNPSKQISINKFKNKSEAHSILQDELDEQEKEVIEKPKKLNFHPIQEPSINWNESPLKQNKYDQEQKRLFLSRNQEYNQRQQIFPTNNVQQKPQEIEEQPSDDEPTNHIEQRLHHLLEETRRKLNNFDSNEESSQSDDQMMGGREAYSEHQQQEINYMQRMRNKAQTPQLNTQNFQSYNYQQQMTYNQQPQVQMQPAPPMMQQPPPYIYEPQYPPQQMVFAPQQNPLYPQYGGVIYPSGQQQQQQQPMITIINPNPMNYPGYNPQYGMYSQQQAHYGVPVQQQQQNMMINQQTIDVQNSYSGYNSSSRQQQQQQLDKVNQSYGSSNSGEQNPPHMLNQNASLIIGMDSQFFFPNKSNENSMYFEEDHQKLNPNMQLQQHQQQPPQQYMASNNFGQPFIILPIPQQHPQFRHNRSSFDDSQNFNQQPSSHINQQQTVSRGSPQTHHYPQNSIEKDLE